MASINVFCTVLLAANGLIFGIQYTETVGV